MNPAKHFHVHLGAPDFVDHLAEGPTLVIDPDQGTLDRLEADLYQRGFPFPCRFLSAVVGAKAGQALEWFSFNDRRFDGSLALECWSGRPPNLVCLQQQTLSSSALNELLDTADLPLEEHQTGCLVVRHGDPTAALATAGDWLDRFQIIDLKSPLADLNWAAVVRGQLEPLGFRSSDQDTLWQRPGVQMLRFLLERLQTQRQELVVERDEQMQGRQSMAQQLQALSQQLDNVLVERDELKQHLADLQLQMKEEHREELEKHREEMEQHHQQHQKELEQLQNRWDLREVELQLQALQQESFVARSAAQLNLLTDLVARWGGHGSD